MNCVCQGLLRVRAASGSCGTEMGAIPRSPAGPRVTHYWLTPTLSAAAKLSEEQAGREEDLQDPAFLGVPSPVNAGEKTKYFKSIFSKAA